jgi:hypothetical protein
MLSRRLSESSFGFFVTTTTANDDLFKPPFYTTDTSSNEKVECMAIFPVIRRSYLLCYNCKRFHIFFFFFFFVLLATFLTTASFNDKRTTTFTATATATATIASSTYNISSMLGQECWITTTTTTNWNTTICSTAHVG